ncbi:MAG: amidohydrolase family protein [Rhodospirillaceae bacterium]|nr:amidohydrolase family protein [Rhodospirillaceae bacterium]
MLIDWHTNLWLDEHLTEEHRRDMNVRSGGRKTDASPQRHERDVAGVADRFGVVAIRWPRLGVDVPNDFVADYVSRFPDRAVGFACVDPMDPGAPDELERAIKTLGLHGLKLGPTYQGFDPWSNEAWQLYEIANDLRIPILWHQASAFPAQSILEYGRPYLIDKIARAFPDMRMILAHFGKPWANETVHILRKHKQIFTDVSAVVYRSWEMYDALLRAKDYGVMDQVLFGSDFPVQTTTEALASLRNVAAEYQGMPRISDTVIEDIIFNRPFDLVWGRDPLAAI